MTEADAEKYSTQISSLDYRVDAHTSILKNAVRTLNESAIGLNKHSELINDLNLDLERLKKSYTIDSVYTNTHFKFEELSEYLILALAKIRRDQTKLFGIIFSAKKGILHESLFDPQSKYAEMVTAQLELHSQNFVYPIQKPNTYKILGLSDFSAILTGNILLFEIRTPLIRGDTFKIYNTISIPEHLSGSTFAFIVPEFKSFIMSHSHVYYASFLEPARQLAQDCKQIEGDHFLCNQKYPLFITNVRRNCEIEILLKGDNSMCTKKQ